MPSLNIHIAACNKYLYRNNVQNEVEFLRGTVAPDLCCDKALSHFSGPRNKEDIISSLKNKVNLKKFLLENNINTDYDNGFFLHLLTDYAFSNFFFDRSYLKRVKWDKFKNDLYYSFDQCDPYVKKRYGVKYEINNEKILDDFNKYNKYKYYKDSKNIININNLNKFIDKVSLINLKDIRIEILNDKDISLILK